MKPSLADMLEVVLPALSPALATPEAATRLRAQARLLAPVACAGFECRLRADSPQVDLSQCIRRDEGDPPILAAHLARMASAGIADDPSWARLGEFCAEWMAPSSPLHAGIHNIWLEFDLDGEASGAPAPSIFLSFVPAPWRETLANTERALSLLFGEPLSSPLRENVARCFAACPNVSSVSQIGAMLSRKDEALRVCVQRLAADQILPYLLEIGWPGPKDGLETLMARLGAFSGDITLLDMDVGAGVHPQIGVEYGFGAEPEGKPRWAAFLDALAQQGLCAPEKRAGLLAWPGYTRPTGSPLPWPDFLIAESLLQPPDRFSMIQRKLNHVKITLRPQRPPEAKGYLQFTHECFPMKPAPPKPQKLSLPDGDPRARPAATDEACRAQVRDYYDAATEAYLAHLGSSVQGWLVVGADGREDAAASNAHLAARAGIRPGQRVLDAGCGVCGPAVDIARAIEGVEIDGVTLSPVQARIAQARIREAGLEGRVRVWVADYHDLPFPPETFDVVYFFESSGYSYNPRRLFAEVFRVLRRGGRLYIKDAFQPDRPLSEREREEVAVFNQLFAYRTPTLSQTVEHISGAGFHDIQTADLTGIVGQMRWRQALGDAAGGAQLSAFGELHNYPFRSLPLFCAEVIARKT